MGEQQGYTKVPNDILERIAIQSLNATQVKIIIVIARYTFGFGRSDHGISESFLAKATGISKRYIASELKRLVDGQIVKVIKKSTYTAPRIIGLNSDVSLWDSGTIVQQVKNSSSVEEKQDTTVEELLTSTDEESFIQERKISKEKSKENIYIVFSHWNQRKIITHRTLTDKLSSHINARLEEGYEVGELLTAIDNYAEVLENEKYYWSYKWGLSDFLLKGLDKFKEESEPLKNFLKQKPGGVQSGYDRSNGVPGTDAPRKPKIQAVNKFTKSL